MLVDYLSGPEYVSKCASTWTARTDSAGSLSSFRCRLDLVTNLTNPNRKDQTMPCTIKETHCEQCGSTNPEDVGFEALRANDGYTSCCNECTGSVHGCRNHHGRN
jgi:hypothetical protein